MIDLNELLTTATEDEIFAKHMEVAEAVDLPTTTWQEGDPELALFAANAERIAVADQQVDGYGRAGFLDYATGDWLKLLAEQVYSYTPREATYATATVTFTNGGGGEYVLEAGDLTVKNSATGVTYHTTEGGTIPPLGTLDLDVVCDVAGSDGSCDAGDIDEMVTTLMGVTCASTTDAVGIDGETDADIRAGCRASLGRLSTAGPWDGYASVALDNTLTGATTVTRCRVYDESTTGDVTVYVASATGESSGADVTLVQNAILLWATPLCITPAVYAATESEIAISYTAQVYLTCGYTESECEALIAAKLAELFAVIPIGGDSGNKVYQSAIAGAIYAAIPGFIHMVKMTTPATDTVLTSFQVAKLGTITHDVVLVAAP